MISRCYATAICNNQAIMNTTQFGKSPSGVEPKPPKDLSAPAIQTGRLTKTRAGANVSADF